MPSLTGALDAGPPFWPGIAATVAAAVPDGQPVAVGRPEVGERPELGGRPVVVVAHSNAGRFVPVIVEAIGERVSGCVFVDAALPGEGVTAERFRALRGMAAADGRVPPWTSWWDEDVVAGLFGDAQTRAEVSAEQPRVPVSFFEEEVPVPEGWDERACGYLWFSPAYEDRAREAERRGWAVGHIAGGHVHQVVDPGAVARGIVAVTRGVGG
ncbi:alpha/beta hydrolase [Winogradskya humida]|uniref:Alpha/beta hydrolase family protein n=1 Tax=Winogradskya humida TaxID=113566 RepID=A0ABQ3ZZN3_9ACTN|nr:hypothetical protein Ahu01nite_071720 [Actinoplanes humidus]